MEFFLVRLVPVMGMMDNDFERKPSGDFASPSGVVPVR
jgi:hypothetical protein